MPVARITHQKIWLVIHLSSFQNNRGTLMKFKEKHSKSNENELGKRKMAGRSGTLEEDGINPLLMSWQVDIRSLVAEYCERIS